MSLDSRHLPVFLALMRQKSIGRTAATLGMTQPAASRILQKLEAELGATLFERHPTGVVPTIYAETFLPYAEEIASNGRTALEEMAALKGYGTSTLRIGALASIASSLLPGVIDRLIGKWPNLRVQLIEGADDRLAVALANNEIDIAIAGRMSHNEVQLSAPDTLGDVLAVIARRDHPLASAGPITLAQLADCRWVLPPYATLPMQEFRRRFVAAGLQPPPATIETRSINAIRALVAGTDILSWQPRAAIAFDKQDGRIVELPAADLLWERQFFVFKRRRGFLAPAAAKFLQELRETRRPPNGGSAA